MSKYENVKPIGSGGFGEVWLCKRDVDGQLFAKKQLSPSSDSDSTERFIREVRILSSLDHPNIVRVISKRFHRSPHFYVMPRYEKSLRDELLNLLGQEARILPIYTAILAAIGYAHSQGVIHRDLKPENVLLNSDSDVVVSDFGLGRILDSESTRQTITGFGLGTIFYMAPEQFNNAKNADQRSDIYSLGRILYELYAGPLSSTGQDSSQLPPGIKFIVDRCTAHNPEKRFQGVSELRKVWLDLFDMSERKSETDELVQLRAQFSVPATYETESVNRFLFLLNKFHDDLDLLHETFMMLHVKAIVSICSLNANLAKDLIAIWVHHLVSQNWSFEYTDSIGNKCESIHAAISNQEIRADLVYCVLVVGAHHNRWHVLGILSRLLEAMQRAGEAMVTAERLKLADEWSRKNAAEHLNLRKLHPTIRELFEFAEPDGPITGVG